MCLATGEIAHMKLEGTAPFQSTNLPQNYTYIQFIVHHFKIANYYLHAKHFFAVQSIFFFFFYKRQPLSSSWGRGALSLAVTLV